MCKLLTKVKRGLLALVMFAVFASSAHASEAKKPWALTQQRYVPAATHVDAVLSNHLALPMKKDSGVSTRVMFRALNTFPFSFWENYDMHDCVFVGDAASNSLRVFIEVDTMTCSARQGPESRLVKHAVKAHVIGKDAQAGLSGLVSLVGPQSMVEVPPGKVFSVVFDEGFSLKDAVKPKALRVQKLISEIQEKMDVLSQSISEEEFNA